MMGSTEGLKVVGVPKQRRVAAVWLDVIDYGRNLDDFLRKAHQAQRGAG